MEEERIEIASKFLLQSPPGEINDVLNDIRQIVSDDDSLQTGVLPALEEYNIAQFIVADVPGCDHQSIISNAARVEGAEQRFLDPRSKQTYRFDHLSLEASDPQPYEPPSDSEGFRTALESSVLTYLSGHFHDGTASVFATPSSSTHFILQIVANKYNPGNYWAGRWRSEYIIDLEQKHVEGRILVNVHYYEQGNVQLESKTAVHLDLPPSITASGAQSASKIIAQIEDEENKYQRSLSDTYTDMSSKTFKDLRRALPLTRQKLDWDRVLGYKLGAELSASKGVFGGSS